MSRTREGWVYVLRNPLFLSYRKIGETGRTVEKRTAEIRRGYGTELEWVKESKHWTTDRRASEVVAHRLLHRSRVKGSEMFKCSSAKARETVLRAIHIVEIRRRRWYWRFWYWLILPRPERAPQRRRRAGNLYSGGIGLLLAGAVMMLIVLLAKYKPELPDWLPASTRNAAALIERL